MKICRLLYFNSLWIVFLAFFVCHFGLANIDNLKGTYSILKDEYKHLSVIHGAIADEKDYLMRLYDYGSVGAEKDVKDQAGVVYKVPDVTNAPAVVKLVHLFFHRNPGTRNPSDFVSTLRLRDASQEAKKSIVKAIAWMIGTVEKAKKQEKVYKTILVGLEKITQPPVQSIGDEEVGQMQELSEFTQKITDVLKAGSASHGWLALKNFLKLVFLATSQEIGKQAIFPPNTVNTVLLGIVYRLAGDDKKLLRSFYEKLNEVLADAKINSIFVDDKIPDDWVEQRFYFAEQEGFTAQINGINPSDVEAVSASFEKIVYLALLPGKYPQRSGFAKAYYSYDEADKSKNVKFSDCMETTFRNLLNILFYEKETGGFNLEKIAGLKIAGLEINQSMKDFYFSNSKVTAVKDQQSHDAWTNVIENIQFVAYNRKVGTKQKSDKIGKKGFIKIPEDVTTPEKFDASYEREALVDVIYEIQPSLRNIIIVLNYLLGLNLFAEEKVDGENNKIAQAFLRDDFIKYYFPKMCEKLHVEFKPWDEKFGNVDENDYTEMEIETLLKVWPEEINPDVKINTSLGHGRIDVLAKQEEKINLDMFSSLSDDRLFSLFYLIWLRKEFAKSHFNEMIQFDETHVFNTLFWLPIDNPDFVGWIIEKTIELKYKFNLQSLKLLKSLISKNPDAEIKTNLELMFKVLVVSCERWNHESGVIGIPGSSANDLIQEAENGMKSGRISFAMKLYKALFEKGQGFEEAIKVAENGIRTHLLFTMLPAIELYKALVENGQGFDGAIKAAENVMNTGNLDVLQSVLRLYKVLVENGQGYEGASKAAEIGIKSDSWSRGLTMGLYRALFKKGRGFDSAIKAAGILLESGEPDARRLALELYKALFEKGWGFNSAIKVAGSGVRSDDLRVRYSAINLYKALVEKRHGFEDAIKAAQIGMGLDDFSVVHAALELYKALVEKEQGFEGAIRAAGIGIKIENLFIIQSAIELYEVLVEKEQGFEGAIKAVGIVIKYDDSSVRALVVKLYKALLEKLKTSEAMRPLYSHAIEVGMAVGEETEESKKIKEMAITLQREAESM